MPMADKKLNKIANWITIISGIITFLNLAVSIKFNLKLPDIVFPNLFRIDFPFRLIAFLFLEGVLAHIFGSLLIYIENLGPGLAKIILSITGLLSAWTSIFNIQWILIGIKPEIDPEQIYFAKLMGGTLLAYISAIYFIVVHGKQRYVEYPHNEITFIFEDTNLVRCIFVQTISFLTMFLVFVNS